MSNKQKEASKPLPLTNVLKDLAIIRSSGRDLAEVIKFPSVASPSQAEVDGSVSASYDFVRVSRAAIKLRDSGKVEQQGNNIEQVRAQYSEVLDGLQEGASMTG